MSCRGTGHDMCAPSQYADTDRHVVIIPSDLGPVSQKFVRTVFALRIRSVCVYV